MLARAATCVDQADRADYAQMEARRLQYLSRMGVDVWRRRNHGAAPAADSAEVTRATATASDAAPAETPLRKAISREAPSPELPPPDVRAQEVPVAESPAASAPIPAGASTSRVTAPNAGEAFDAHWVRFDACVVIAAEPSKLIDDVVSAFAGQAQRASGSERLPDAGSLAQRLTTFEGVALVFGEPIAQALTGEFVPNDIQSLGAARIVCAESPAAYIANPMAKRHLWRALCQLRASVEAETAAG